MLLNMYLLKVDERDIVHRYKISYFQRILMNKLELMRICEIIASTFE